MSNFPTLYVVHDKIYVDNNLPESVHTNKCRHQSALNLVFTLKKEQVLKGFRQLDAERDI